MKVGDYVRTDNGCICKILKYTDISDNDFYVNTDSPYDVIYKSWIVKSSPNIIDLIEEGDYVNGCYVLREHYTYIGEHFIELDTNDSWDWGIGNMPTKYIKSIVTKEQFSQMEYKVE